MSDKQKNLMGMIFSVALIVFVAWVNYASNSSTEVAKDNDCKSNYKQCKDNADMANNYSEWFDAQYACKEKFGELVKYGTPEYKLGDSYAFSSFLAGDDYPKKGIATLIAKVAVQNEFGTKVNGEQSCEFDLDAKKVIKQYGDFNAVNGFFISDDYEAINKSREQRTLADENLTTQSNNLSGNYEDTYTAPSSTPPKISSDENMKKQVITDFYNLLSKGDINAAEDLLIFGKRNKGNFESKKMESFFGHMKEPINLISIEATGEDEFEVTYKYKKDNIECKGKGIIETYKDKSNGAIYIAKISSNC